MPRKPKTSAAAQKAEHPQIPAELLEQLIPGPVTPAEFEDNFGRFKKAFMERALGAEMSQHLSPASEIKKPAPISVAGFPVLVPLKWWVL